MIFSLLCREWWWGGDIEDVLRPCVTTLLSVGGSRRCQEVGTTPGSLGGEEQKVQGPLDDVYASPLSALPVRP